MRYSLDAGSLVPTYRPSAAGLGRLAAAGLACLLAATLAAIAAPGAKAPARAQPALPAGTGRLTHLGRLDGASLADAEFQSMGIAANGNLLYVASESLDVYDVSRPGTPVRIATVMHPSYPGLVSGFAGENWMDLQGSLLTLAGTNAVLLDVTNPRAPRVASVLNAGSPAGALLAMGPRAYWASEAVLQIYDITDPTEPERLGEEVGFGMSPIDIAVDGSKVYLWHFLGGRVYDAQDPSALHPERQFHLKGMRELCEATEAWQRRSIAFRDQKAYVTCGRSLAVIDFALPAVSAGPGLPDYTEAGLFEAQDFTTHVTLVGDWVLLTDLQNLYVLDTSDPTHIKELARFEHTSPSEADRSHGIAMSAVSGQRVYVSSDDYGSRPGHVDILEIDRPLPVGMAYLPWSGTGGRR